MTSDAFETAAQALRLAHPDLREAAELIRSARFEAAAAALRKFLDGHPNDAPARFAYARALLSTNAPDAALVEIETLLARAPRNPLIRSLKATVLEAMEDHGAAASVWRGILDEHPMRSDIRLSYGHALRGAGASDEAIAAYRKAIALDPDFGAAYWALADMKTFRFGEADVAAMEDRLARATLSQESRTRLHFALGKALSDERRYEQSFAHYAKGNALHRLAIKHDPDVLGAYVARCKRLFTPEFLSSRAGQGSLDIAPIFIVGMARSGSTLIEQILASHSQVEGTRELSDLAALARMPGYPESLASLDGLGLRALGERYLAQLRAHRKSGRPRFTDKMGMNFVHTGLIRLILPNAKIVDMRRHPLACGVSNFAQLFPQGQNDAYRLSDIGKLYRDYVELMAHFDRVAPDAVHRVFYEDLVAEPEREVRRLLDALDLPFEPACLDFHKTGRVVTTASSEQVRRPLYRDALEQWRGYEPWLGPLKAALGPVLEAYPGVPAF